MAGSSSKTSIIYLLGMPGCGKSTLGRKLALSMKCDFVDLDTYIEKQAGLTIPEIFSKLGENEFRLLEQKAVKESTTWTNTIVACGGGAPCFFDNMDKMNNSGKTVYINVSPDEIHRRMLNRGQNNRPLLQNKNSIELLQELKTKKANRDQYYSKAQKIIFNDNLILEILKSCL